MTWVHSGKTSVVTIASDMMWQTEYRAGFIARPNDRRSKNGDRTQASYPKLRRTNELIARLDGRWCYLGTLAGTRAEGVTYEEWVTFPGTVSCVVECEWVQLTGPADARCNRCVQRMQ